ncbi:hypothetical protein J1C08_003449 [Escherichia fergusonii]|nr:hypothetical protein [Escherichia fergusonii]
MKTVLCIGNATWDQTFTVSDDQLQAAKCYAHAFTTNGGGVAATAAVAIANWQAPVEFIGRVGADPIGDQIIEELIAHGVEVKNCLCYEQAKTSIATIVLSDDHSSKIFVFNDPNMPKDTSSLFALDLAEVSAVVADLTWPEGSKVLFERARQQQIPTFLRVSFFDDRLLELLTLADFCVFNHPSLLAMTSDINHKRALNKASKRIGGTPVVTLGGRGCAWLHEGDYGELSAHPVKVLDTTGAGDIFIGILALHISRGASVARAMEIANHTASLSCEMMGARELRASEAFQQLIAENNAP